MFSSIANMSTASLDKLIKQRKQLHDEESTKAIFEKERECLELLLHARKLLSYLVKMRDIKNTKEKEEKERAKQEEAKKKGNLNVTEIQQILQMSPEQEETDWLTEIQNLKKELQIEVRKNHILERELAKLDKRIGLLIRNRGQLKMEKPKKKDKKKKGAELEKEVPDFSQNPKQVELYQDLFYLLQTETRYMANVIYLIQQEDVTSFLDTVIITLYGDAFSPREEFLLLKLFQNAIQIELQYIKKVKSFITGETVVPKMCITYNKRKQGIDYLKIAIDPVLKKVMQRETEMDLQVNPVMIYQKMITDLEIKTGKPSDLPRNVSEEEAMKHKHVEETLEHHLADVKNLCGMFLEAIISTIDSVPYGLRWICKALKEACFARFPEADELDIWRLIGYFVYYRFLNVAIVAPDTFKLVDTKDLKPSVRKGLVDISIVLQNLFNLIEFGDKEKVYMQRLNPFIRENLPAVKNYLKQLCEVDDPEDKLQVNQYNELVQKARPAILIGTHEISNVHHLLDKYLNRIAPDQNDPLRVVLKDLGEAPPKPKEDKDIQLWLTNRFNINIDEESETQKLYSQTKELILPVLRNVPIEASIQKLNLMDVLENGIKHAAETKNKQLSTQINTILENIQKLEQEGIVTKNDNYESLVHDIALEVANRRVIRENQRKEIARLTQALAKLRSHQNYLKEQKKDYNEYLQGARKSVYSAPKKKSKKKKDQGKGMSFKFTYKELSKRGVILDSEVPEFSRKTCSFTISSSEYGVFEIVAKVAGIEVEQMTLELDDLLERRYNNLDSLELDQVTLGVNMTIHLVNEYFLMGKKK